MAATTRRPELTIVIPTRNRAALLATSLSSALAQDWDNLTVVVHDNASTDGTARLVRACADARLRYERRPSNVGLFRNWNDAVAGVRSPYVAVLQDDDLLRPGFATSAVEALERAPSAAFCSVDAELVDGDGTPVGARAAPLSGGLVAGLDYLQRIVAGENIIIDMSAMVLRTSALRAVGSFDVPHQIHDIVFALQFRLAAQHDFVHLPERLVAVRQHAGQAHRGEFAVGGAIGMTADRSDALAYLLRSERAVAPAYRRWLADRLLWLGQLRSQYTWQAMPGLNLTAEERIRLAVDDLVAAVPAGAGVVLVDEAAVRDERLGRWRVWPFTERDGEYHGPPTDGAAAVRELDRLRAAGAEYLAVVWTAFWWLDYYAPLREHLAACCDHPIDNSRVQLFHLRSAPRR